MLKKMVLALSTALIVVIMAFSAVALAHDPGAHDHGDPSRGHSEERPISGKQQASHSDGGPSPWLPVAFTLSGVVVLVIRLCRTRMANAPARTGAARP